MTLINFPKDVSLNSYDCEHLIQDMLEICQRQDPTISLALLSEILKIEEKYSGDEVRRKNQLWDLLINEKYTKGIILEK